MNQHQLRANVLADYGATAQQTQELLAYNQNTFDHSFSTLRAKFPLPPEPHVAAWEEYAVIAQEIGVFQALSSKLVQLKFPILQGISQTQVYRFATRKGMTVDGMIEATGLILQQPEQLQLILHQSLAGVIPVLLTRNREDFVSLVQALTMRNEPKPVPASMGACMVTGLNNWDRVRQYRQQWSAKNFGNCSESSWLEEFGRLIPQKQLYQDRLIILSDGFYSNVSASDIGLLEPEWWCISMTIRLEHECTHYFTHRLFGSMRNNLLDELIADYRGIVAAIGHYRADWFLRFLGLESFPDYREGGRLQNYRGQPPLSEGAFKILQALVKSAAENLERFDAEHGGELRTLNSQPIMLIALTYLTLEELADSKAHSYIQKILDQLPTTLTEGQVEYPETKLKFI
ncbi:hypothetical protein NIES4072_26300 [Nostoc commune NIES-4072]|uniref:Uncharacterized protein n=1 Tax=Nostoc commune NIES-4072 TaxID=2005467 RepID=A0A2R5FL21_NOSCO|nr:hypothetical protein [Nostoc commune]BBD63714.1 hypothetical protein NIES4070_00560 [Nostoc commune HK-02]GBG18965.1 hypothetical protein NIES4072_26300 [Nostoc commune NIES-4072]